MNSLFGKLNLIDWKKIGVGAVLAVIGALLTYFTQFITNADFGIYTPIIVSAWSILANIVRKWLTDQDGKFLGAGN